MGAEVSIPPPADAPVKAPGGGKGPPVDSFATDIPVGGGVPAQQLGVQQGNLDTAQAGIAGDQGQVGTPGTLNAKGEMVGGTPGVQGAQAVEQGAAAAVPVAQAEAADVGAIHKQMMDRYTRSLDEYDRAKKAAESAKYEDHWADQDTGTKVLAGISSFLGGYATGRPVNRAQEWIDRDHDQQKDQIDRLFKIAEQKGAEPQHLMELEQSAVRNIDAAYQAKLEAYKREVEHQAAKLGTQQAAVNARKLIADAEQAKLAHDTKALDAMGIHAVAHTLQSLGRITKNARGNLTDMRVIRNPDGTSRKFYRNPLTGNWAEFIAPGAPVPGMPVPAPVQPPAQAAP